MTDLDKFQNNQFKIAKPHLRGNQSVSTIYRPEYETEQPKKEFCITLRSKDVASIAGNTVAYSVFPIKLPNFTAKKCKVQVRSIVFANSTSSYATNIGAGLHIREFINLNSYSSARGGPDDQIGQIQGYNYVNLTPFNSEFLIDSYNLTNTQLTIYWTNQVGPDYIGSAPSGVPTDPWSIELLLCEM
ncbi:MAG: hypothetical protein EOP34_03460 [Rickettsiales bacterium]|nr:MAG: hypothetical protein EOP34_03460 [Rickettsiales bacterium]